MTIFTEGGDSATAHADGHRTYRRVFVTRGPDGMTVEQHLAAPGLPKVGDPWRNDHFEDPRALCRRMLSPEPVPGGYRLTFIYATDPTA